MFEKETGCGSNVVFKRILKIQGKFNSKITKMYCPIRKKRSLI